MLTRAVDQAESGGADGCGVPLNAFVNDSIHGATFTLFW